MSGRVVAVVGAQYGSEGKGVIAAHIGRRMADYHKPMPMYVRTGGPNAGHTVTDADGTLHKVRSVPVGFLFKTSPLVIGRAAAVSLPVLAQEMDRLERAGFDVHGRVMLDPKAAHISLRDSVTEEQTRRVEAIGSTGEGVGMARERYLRRDALAYPVNVLEAPGPLPPGIVICDTVQEIHDWYDDGGDVILEGTQGFGLSLYHGPTWPYCTSRDCTASQLANDCGLPATWIDEIVLVVRRYPIRVGGNSGPFTSPELTWDDISERCGRRVQEFTTVTQRLRRVAEFDPDMVRRAAMVNGATCMALNFVDYDKGNEPGIDHYALLQPHTLKFIRDLEQHVGIPVRYIGSGRKNEQSGFTVISR